MISHNTGTGNKKHNFIWTDKLKRIRILKIHLKSQISLAERQKAIAINFCSFYISICIRKQCFASARHCFPENCKSEIRLQVTRLFYNCKWEHIMTRSLTSTTGPISLHTGLDWWRGWILGCRQLGSFLLGCQKRRAQIGFKGL